MTGKVNTTSQGAEGGGFAEILRELPSRRLSMIVVQHQLPRPLYGV